SEGFSKSVESRCLNVRRFAVCALQLFRANRLPASSWLHRRAVPFQVNRRLDLSLLTTKACCVGWRQFGDACTSPMRSGVCAFRRAPPAHPTMPEQSRARTKDRRRAGRPPAGAKEGEKVKDYPQLSIRVPVEFKARLNALSAVTG